MKLKIAFVILLFVFLISLTGVSAVDNQTDNNSIDSTDMINEKDNVLVEKNNEEITNGIDDGTFSALQNMINNANSSTITLEHDYAYDEGFTVDGIKITKNFITIDGKNHTINANNKARIFNITGKNVSLKNINFINGLSEKSGSAIYWHWLGSNGTVSNCNFIDNIANRVGGAIYWWGNNGTVSNCNFIDNIAKGDYGGGAIYWEGNNGNISDSSFINNTAKGNGGAIYWYSKNSTVSNSIFINNTATMRGSAIYWYKDKGIVFNSIFINNKDNIDGNVLVCVIGLDLMQQITLMNQTKIPTPGYL